MAEAKSKTLRYSLESVGLFKGLSAPTLEQIKQRCHCLHYQPRELIVDHMDTSNEVFFVVAGNARVTIRSSDGKAVSFRELGPGAMFGEYAAIDGRPRSASVEALSSCLVVSMKASVFHEILATEPQVTKRLLEHFVKEIRELTTRVFEFSTLAVRNRIQAEILRLAYSQPCKGKIARIVPAPTHAEIASRTSTHREAVTRELNRLAKIGLLEQRNREFWVTDVDRLAALVKSGGEEAWDRPGSLCPDGQKSYNLPKSFRPRNRA